MELSKQEIIDWLKEEDQSQLTQLWRMADSVRKRYVGGDVHLRGLIEVSNYCARQCTYCGLRLDRKNLQRYRMTREEIIECAHEAVSFGYGTVVLQAGEDYGIKADWLGDIIREIKAATPLAVTLSMGERPLDELRQWRRDGADRYLLRFETSDPELYDSIHPPLAKDQLTRMEILVKLRELGYEIGSGVMIGLPDQSFDILANDIMLFEHLNLDMIGVGPYIPNDDTPLASVETALPPGQQVPNSELMVYKVIALTRLVCPEANIPSTTALASLNKGTGRENGLNRGANIVMPNVTPQKYRELYEIYPAKVCIDEAAADCRYCIQGRIRNIDRGIGAGPGSRQNGVIAQ